MGCPGGRAGKLPARGSHGGDRDRARMAALHGLRENGMSDVIGVTRIGVTVPQDHAAVQHPVAENDGMRMGGGCRHPWGICGGVGNDQRGRGLRGCRHYRMHPVVTAPPRARLSHVRQTSGRSRLVPAACPAGHHSSDRWRSWPAAGPPQAVCRRYAVSRAEACSVPIPAGLGMPVPMGAVTARGGRWLGCARWGGVCARLRVLICRLSG